MSRFTISTCSTLISAALVLALSSCSTPEEGMAAQGWWSGDRMTGSPKIVIDLGRQVVRYYKGGQLAGAAPISSGREGYGTVRGRYRIIEKDADHRSSIYGSFVTGDGTIVERDVDVRRDAPPPGTRFLGASMRSFMRITGGIGMHEGYLPGFAASHGCIRLPSRMAAIFYRATPLGTPVEIIGEAPDGHLTTWLPVPHKLHRDDIVVAPKDEGDTRPKAQVAIAEPEPTKPKPVEKAAPKPAVEVASVSSRASGQTQFLEQKAKPAKTTEVAKVNSQKGSFWSLLVGGDDNARTEPDKSVVRVKTAPSPAPVDTAPVVASAPPPSPKPVTRMTAAKQEGESQSITYQPLANLDQKSSSWGWMKKKPVETARPVKKGAARGQTYYLPGVR